ncbi:MAG: hypothetical protein HY606_01745 [Planctomycetes bacterium]|nr:hypothetical protein [Planctomycetota bacterium]
MSIATRPNVNARLPAVQEKPNSGPVEPLTPYQLFQMQGRFDRLMAEQAERKKELEQQKRLPAIPETARDRAENFYLKHSRIQSDLDQMITNKETGYHETVQGAEAAVRRLNSEIAKAMDAVDGLKRSGELAELRERLEGRKASLVEGQIDSINTRLKQLQTIVDEMIAERQGLIESLERIKSDVENTSALTDVELYGTSQRLRELGNVLEQKRELTDEEVQYDGIKPQLALNRGYRNSYFDFLLLSQERIGRETSEVSSKVDKLSPQVYILLLETNMLIQSALANSRRIESIALEVRGDSTLRKLKEGIYARRFSVPSGDIERLNSKITRLNAIASTKIESSSQSRRLEERARSLKKDILEDAERTYEKYNGNKPKQTFTALQIIGNAFLDIANGAIDTIAGLRSVKKLFTLGLAIFSIFNALNFTAPKIAQAAPSSGGSQTARRDMTDGEMYQRFRDNHYGGLRQSRDLALTEAEFNDISELYSYIVRNLDPNMSRNEFFQLFGFQGKEGVYLVGNAGSGWLPLAATHMVELKRGLKEIRRYKGSVSDDVLKKEINKYKQGLQTLWETAKKEHQDYYDLASGLRKRAIASLVAAGGSPVSISETSTFAHLTLDGKLVGQIDLGEKEVVLY